MARGSSECGHGRLHLTLPKPALCCAVLYCAQFPHVKYTTKSYVTNSSFHCSRPIYRRVCACVWQSEVLADKTGTRQVTTREGVQARDERERERERETEVRWEGVATNWVHCYTRRSFGKQWVPTTRESQKRERERNTTSTSRCLEIATRSSRLSPERCFCFFVFIFYF